MLVAANGTLVILPQWGLELLEFFLLEVGRKRY
jgi:hypothetical protein